MTQLTETRCKIKILKQLLAEQKYILRQLKAQKKRNQSKR